MSAKYASYVELRDKLTLGEHLRILEAWLCANENERLAYERK